MRLDKFLTVTGTATRSESKKAARAGDVTVNGVTVKDTSVQINDNISRRSGDIQKIHIYNDEQTVGIYKLYR